MRTLIGSLLVGFVFVASAFRLPSPFHHLSTRSARRVFQRLGAPRRSSSKYVLPFQRFCSDQRPSRRWLLRTMSIASARRWSRGALTAWK